MPTPLGVFSYVTEASLNEDRWPEERASNYCALL